MVSPDAVEQRPHSSKGYMRRSRSSEDILNVAGLGEAEDGVGEDFRPTKIGGLVVVPEPKYKSRGKLLLSKMKRKKNMSTTDASPVGSEGGCGIASEGTGDPVLLAYGYLLSSDGTGMRSPKNMKKRQRLPHFV